MATTIPELQSRAKLQLRFPGLSAELINNVVDFLVTTRLISEREGKLSTGVANLRIGKESAHVLRHHTNWRLRAIESLPAEGDLDLHYSASVSISAKDAAILKE